MSRLAVVLMNLGGPDRLESVQPFLFNLFNDPAIIGLPQPLRWIVAQALSRRRAPIARRIYEEIGGGSPLLQNTAALGVDEGSGLRRGRDRSPPFARNQPSASHSTGSSSTCR